MPARPAVPDVIKVEFLWSLGGIPGANVKYVKYSGTAPTAGACAAIAALLGDAWWPDVEAYYTTHDELTAVRVTDLATDTGAQGSAALALTGSDDNPSVPSNACVLVNHTISRRYRGGHPRTYYPPGGVDWMATQQTWTPDLVTAFGNAEAAYALAASTFSESGCEGVYNVNVSYRTGDAPRVDPVVDQITGSTVASIIRTQRRRLTASSY